MGCEFPEHHGSGGSGIAGALIVLLAAIVGVAIMPFLGLIAHIVNTTATLTPAAVMFLTETLDTTRLPVTNPCIVFVVMSPRRDRVRSLTPSTSVG